MKGQPFIDKVKGSGIEQDCPKVAEEVYKFFYLLEYNHIHVRVRKTRVLNHKTQPSGFLRVNPYTHWVAGSDQY